MRDIEQNSKSALEHFEAACRREGLPVTVQRRVIFSAVLERHDHPTVDQIFAQVKDRIPGVSRTTVYRTLETLASLRLVRRTNHFAASARYDGNMEQHHHLVCTTCGKVIDFQDSTLTVSNLPDGRCNGFSLLDYSIYFEGSCADCKRHTNPPKARRAKGKPS